jgi:PAS domain S-box-containing protein
VRESLRDSGIEVIGNVPWGTHICQFYHIKQDLVDIIVPYIKAGLRNNEFCVLVTAGSGSARRILKAMKRHIPGFSKYLKKGQIEVLFYDEWYLYDGLFDGKRALDCLVDKLEQSLIKAYKSMRFVVDTYRLKKKDWGKYFDYEQAVDRLALENKLLVLCACCLDKRSGTEMADLVRVHKHNLLKIEGRWKLLEKSGYKTGKKVSEHRAEPQTEVADRKDAEQVMKVDRQRFNDVLDMLPAYLVLLSPNYEVLFVNRFFRERFGEPRGLRCFEYLFGRTEPCLKCDTFKVLDTNEPVQWEWLGPDGRNYYIYDFPFTDVDGSSIIMEVGIDVTEQKQVQEALRKAHEDLEMNVQERTRELRESEEKYRGIVNTANEGIWVTSPVGETVFINRQMVDMLGYTGEEIGNRLITDFIEEREKEKITIIRAELRAGEKLQQELLFRHKSGKTVWLLGSITGMFDDTGRHLGNLALYTDITERKQTEEALYESQRDLNRAQAMSHTGSWRLDFRKNQLIWSDETYRMFGIPEKTPMTYEKFLAVVHPDELDMVDRAWKAAIRGEPYDIEHRIIVGDRVKWVNEKAELDFDSQGNLRSGFGTVHEITERKMAEEALQRSRSKMGLLAETASLLLSSTRPEHLVEDICNRIMVYLDCKVFLNYLVDERAGRLHLNSYAGIPEDVARDIERIDFGVALSGCVAQEGKRIVAENITDETEDIANLVRHFGVSAYACYPLYSRGQVIGTLSFGSSSKSEFADDELDLMHTVAVQVATAMEQKITAEKLREARDYLNNLLDHARAPIIVWDSEYRITRFNHAFERLTGFKASDVVDSSLKMLFPKGEVERSLKYIRRAIAGERWEAVEIPVQRINGEVRTVLWNSATIFASDGKTLEATIAQGQDITERKRVDELKDEFIGLVSHELRTPLTVITGSIRTIMTENLSGEDTQMLLENAADGADELAAILDNLLELSRYQARRLSLNVGSIKLKNLVNNVVNRLQSRSVAHRFTLNISPELRVQADQIRLERILFNLMENAVKYSPRGSEIKVTAGMDDNNVIIRVSDHGAGIPQEDLGKLFEPFQRLETVPNRKGLGLGLVVCKRLVEAHGGHIWIESKVGVGSTFSLTLPLKREK